MTPAQNSGFLSGMTLPLTALRPAVSGAREQPASPEPPSPWILGEVFTRDGVDYELVTAGEIKLGELGCGKGAVEKGPAACLVCSACEIVTIRVFAIRRPPRRSSYFARRTLLRASSEDQERRR